MTEARVRVRWVPNTTYLPPFIKHSRRYCRSSIHSVRLSGVLQTLLRQLRGLKPSRVIFATSGVPGRRTANLVILVYRIVHSDKNHDDDLRLLASLCPSRLTAATWPEHGSQWKDYYDRLSEAPVIPALKSTGGTLLPALPALPALGSSGGA